MVGGAAGSVKSCTAGVEPVTVKLAVAVPAAYPPAAAWVACSVTVPAPVSVTTFPATVAGPLTTEYVIAPLEFDVAETANGDAPYVLVAIVLNISDGAETLTVKLTIVVAALYPPAAA